MTPTARPIALVAAMSAILGAIGVAGGCAAVGFVAKAIADNPDIPPAYELADRSTVVFVDDPAHLLANLTVGSTIAQRITADLRANKTKMKIIEPTAIDDLRAGDAAFAQIPVDVVGQRVGADQVIYVLIDSFTIGDEQGVYRPLGSARVKVIDVPSRRRIFPGNEQGHTVTRQLNYNHESVDARGQLTVLTRSVAEQLGRDIGFLFYTHKRPDSDVAVK
jgi:hypothetical protein